jgi:hypothetical protein
VTSLFPKYCLDANVLIQAWQNYYSPVFCPDYWKILNQLGSQDVIFLPQDVSDEITRTHDDLAVWLKNSNIPVYKKDGPVTLCLKNIYSVNPDHKFLVSENNKHSLADPWVIAHAMNQNAIVVTKEIKDAIIKPVNIKIPHVCDNMGIRWIDDFQMVKELNIRFSCLIP